jgi:microcystin-dependent protein
MPKFIGIDLPLETPIGVIQAHAGSSAPDGWLLCNGSAILRTGTYAKLFAAISTTYGIGDGTSTFNLPNTQGLFLRGAGSQTISALTYTGTLGSRAVDTTKKNGLTASASTSSVSVSGNQDQFNYSSGSQGVQFAGGHSHGSYLRYGGGADAQAGLGAFGGPKVSFFSDSAGSHAHSFGGTFSAFGTASAPSVTINTGDAETRPANLGVNYIIKF